MVEYPIKKPTVYDYELMVVVSGLSDKVRCSWCVLSPFLPLTTRCHFTPQEATDRICEVIKEHMSGEPLVSKPKFDGEKEVSSGSLLRAVNQVVATRGDELQPKQPLPHLGELRAVRGDRGTRREPTQVRCQPEVNI